MSNTKFKDYEKIKKLFNFKHKNVYYNKILTPEFIKIVYFEDLFSKMTFYDFFKIFFSQICFKQIKESFEVNDILVTNANDRNDTLELISSCLGSIKKYGHVRLSSLNRFTALNHNFKDIYECFAFFFSKENSEYSFKIKLYLAVSTMSYINAYKSLFNLMANVNLTDKKYVAFNSAYDLESLITQYFKSRGVKTYHLSHGLSYIKYNIFQPFDCVTGENINADTILVWGESSESDLLTNYPKTVKNKSIIVAGNAKYPLKLISLKNKFKNCIVFLARNIYDKENLELLKLIGKVSINTGIQFSVKCHPFSDENAIKIIANKYNLELLPKALTITELLNCNKYDFSICYNTTVYYEAMYYDMFCFRYVRGENENYIGLNDRFLNEMELEKLIELYRNKDLSEVSKQAEVLLTKTLGYGINKYKIIFS